MIEQYREDLTNEDETEDGVGKVNISIDIGDDTGESTAKKKYATATSATP